MNRIVLFFILCFVPGYAITFPPESISSLHAHGSYRWNKIQIVKFIAKLKESGYFLSALELPRNKGLLYIRRDQEGLESAIDITDFNGFLNHDVLAYLRAFSIPVARNVLDFIAETHISFPYIYSEILKTQSRIFEDVKILLLPLQEKNLIAQDWLRDKRYPYSQIILNFFKILMDWKKDYVMINLDKGKLIMMLDHEKEQENQVLAIFFPYNQYSQTINVLVESLLEAIDPRDPPLFFDKYYSEEIMDGVYKALDNVTRMEDYRKTPFYILHKLKDHNP